MNRKFFLQLTSMGMTGSLIFNASKRPGTSLNKSIGFYKVDKKNGRWWLVSPNNDYQFSIGLNHLDPAAIRFSESEGIWDTRYGNSMKKWLTKVKSDLTEWGFNCLGWDQEVVIIKPEMHRHSRSFTYEEYQWLDMPYFHMLPIIESHQWEWETKLPDINGAAFTEWCDYVARNECARFKNDPKLIGYFFTDCPVWIHSNKNNSWKAPIFDPEMEKSESGRKEIFETASHYYKTIVESIRRYDPNHMICGDRYEANAPISEEILSAAIPYIDIFSFQCFSTPEDIYSKLSRWAKYTGKPVLLADSSIRKGNTHEWPPVTDSIQDDVKYYEILRKLRELPECIGFHLCGAYIKNNSRRYGLVNLHEQEEPSTPGIKEANFEQLKWCKSVLNQ
jgi:hypothetical protein